MANRTFDMVAETPQLLKDWWRNLSIDQQDRVKAVLGNLISLMEHTAMEGIVEAAVHYWDADRAIFHFGSVEFTPLLEEIGGLTQLPFESEEVLMPKNIAPEEFFEMVGFKPELCTDSIRKSGISLTSLYIKFGYGEAFQEAEDYFNINQADWQERRVLAFVTSFLGTVIFPEHKGRVDVGMVSIAYALLKYSIKKCTLVPMIVAEMYRALERCKKGASFFEGCNLLLQIWLMEHLHKKNFTHQGFHSIPRENYIFTHTARMDTALEKWDRPTTTEGWHHKLSQLTSENIQWMFDYFPGTTVITRSERDSFLILVGFRGVYSYTPLRALRQAGRKQIVPQIADIRSFKADIFGGVIPFKDKILELWKARHRMGFETIGRDRFDAGYDDDYPDWLRKDIEKVVQPRATKKRKRNADELESECKRLHKQLAKAREKITKNQSLVETKDKEKDKWRNKAELLTKRIESIGVWASEGMSSVADKGIEEKGSKAWEMLENFTFDISRLLTDADNIIFQGDSSGASSSSEDSSEEEEDDYSEGGST